MGVTCLASLTHNASVSRAVGSGGLGANCSPPCVANYPYLDVVFLIFTFSYFREYEECALKCWIPFSSHRLPGAGAEEQCGLLCLPFVLVLC